MKILNLISRKVAQVTSVITGLLIMVVFVVIFIGIGGRIVKNNPAWTEEIARWGLVAIGFLGGSVAVYKRQHVGVNIIITRLPIKIAKVATIIAYIIVIIVCAICLLQSYDAAIRAVRIRGDILPFSMMYVKLFLPLGFGCMIIHLVAGLANVFSHEDVRNLTIGQ
ncbi:MAG: TRAP transporter small permease [Spirochaetaceae bacterium]|nr:TRAP transporter small permease [Spirochaetaceae bacterium]